MGAQPTKKVSGKPALSTAERIVLASIELFNREGVQHVAVKDIAAALKISPGNLTYHFKLKQDLLRAAFAVLQKRMRTVLTPSLPAQSALQGGEYLVNILRAFWSSVFLQCLDVPVVEGSGAAQGVLRLSAVGIEHPGAGSAEMMDKRHFDRFAFPTHAPAG